MEADRAGPLHVESQTPRSTMSERSPIVLVHGFGACNHFWRHWAPELSRTRTVHRVELMGFGRAATPRHGDYSPDAQAAHLVRWMRRSLKDPAILIGHSLGAGVVMLAALRLLDGSRNETAESKGGTTESRDGTAGSKDETAEGKDGTAEGKALLPAGLGVISGAVYPVDLPPYLRAARIRGVGELLLAAPPPRWALRLGIRGIVHDPATVTPEQVEGYHEPLRTRVRRRAIVRAARQIDPEAAARVAPRYAELPIPTLALWGARDRVIPPEFAERLQRDMPDARAVLLDGVGHLPPEEAPQASLAVVQDFLKGLPR